MLMPPEITEDPKPTTLRIEYPYMPPKELRGNSSTRWQQKSGVKNQFQDATIFRLREQNPEPMEKVNVKYIAYWCGQKIDPDNLIIGMKYALDCLTIEGIIKDDNSDFVQSITAEYHRVPRRNEIKLVMEVTEI